MSLFDCSSIFSDFSQCKLEMVKFIKEQYADVGIKLVLFTTVIHKPIGSLD